MSTNVAVAGFSIKLNEELQTERSLMSVAKSLGYAWTDMDAWEEIMYSDSEYKNKWKPAMDDKGKYGVVYLTHYEYDAFDIEHYAKISDMGKALKEFIDQTMIMPKEDIKSFAIIYYNGSESPFKF